MTHPNEALLQTFIEARSRGDTAAMLDCLDDDLIFHLPGRSSLSGTHHGIAELLRLATFLDQRIGGSRSFEPLELFADDDSGMAVVMTHLEVSAAETFDMRNVCVARFSDGKIAELWIYFADQYTVDEIVERLTKVTPTGSGGEPT